MAITYNSGSSGNAGTNTFSITVPTLVNGCATVVFQEKAGTLTGVTLAGVALTLVDHANAVAGTNALTFYSIVAPTSGTQNLIFTGLTSVQFRINFYEGVAQSNAGIDNSGAAHANGGGLLQSTPAAFTVTTTSANAWLVGGDSPSNFNTVASTGTTDRDNTTGVNLSFDSNGGLSIGSNSLNVTWTGTTQNFIWVVAALKPFVAATTNASFLLNFV